MTGIDQLADLYGIGATYADYRGQPTRVTSASRAAILAALGLDVADQRAVDAAVGSLRAIEWQRMVPLVVVAQQGATVVPVCIPASLGIQRLQWTVTLEGGEPLHGSVRIEDLEVMRRGEVAQRQFVRYELPLPVDLPLGYHQLLVVPETGASTCCSLIVTPPRCHEPASLQTGSQRVWGVAVQLYALRSPRNWGMGDFADLRELVVAAAARGCGLVGLNPLHALMPANPAHISPYSPSSRLFLNVLYVAVADVPEFEQCELARHWVADKDFQARLMRLRELPLVDYPQVAAAKFEVLRILYRYFRDTHLAQGTPRATAFRKYVEDRGEPLRLHALFDALDAHWRAQGSRYWGWPSWPQEYHDPNSVAVRRFARERVAEVEYFLYLQWLAETQLSAVQQLAQDHGMSVGLYGDIAVGANPAGSETWSNSSLYVQRASVGAPPDALALKGQDWGLPPQDPVQLRAQQYRPFIAMIRNNMRAVAALRLDHVMSLFRLWWVPGGLTSAQGAYVHYPLDDLISILALESVRHRCLVIGEDLGTVPREMSVAMERYELNHYKVLLFERQAGGAFKTPAQYVRNSLATVTTHDLPTLRGWWESHDIALRERLNLYPNETLRDEVRRTRTEELPAMMHALVAQGLWHWQPSDGLPPYSPALARAIQSYLGLSQAKVVMIQIEDLIGMLDPVNVPGTDREHANWQRKIELDTLELLSRPEVTDIIDAVNLARRGQNPNA